MFHKFMPEIDDHANLRDISRNARSSWFFC